MTGLKDPPRGTRPGGRSARIREAVLGTTLRMLETRPLPELTVKEIATAAGVADTTIYRRWGTLSGLISAAVSEFALAENPIPDTGSLEDDLTQLLVNVAGLIERPSVRRIFRVTMALDNEDAADARRHFWETRFAAGATIIDRAIERGEILPLTDPIEVIEALVGTAYVRAFLLERPMTDAVVRESVQTALRIARRAL
ncbi:TetR/AcrR family transcriptional regulator C-terminal ligand-binding domain-containing protein [Nonomuraea sp. NPDC050328]|uniref:TetR/AcrR family transcriptional regulator n=1 Tax=Nonomuraea sp. NPDC050328 TaxID=3364361 RepID=UPI0037BCF482